MNSKTARTVMLSFLLSSIFYGVGITYLVFERSKLQTQNFELISAVIYAAGKFAQTPSKSAATPVERQDLSLTTREGLNELGLVVAVGQLKVSDLRSGPFESLCYITSEVEQVYPKLEETDPYFSVNELVRRALISMQGDIQKESMSRSLRLGDQHKCPGYRTRR